MLQKFIQLMDVDGEFLREQMNGKGVSVRVAARGLEVTSATVQKWRNGGGITERNALRLCEYFDIDMNDLIEGFVPNTPSAQKDVPQSIGSNILHIPMSAEAGFIGGHLKQVFKEDTEQWMLPGYKAPAYSFEVSGDSMEETLSPGELVITTQQDSSYDDIAEGYVYVIATDDNILIKRAYKEGKGKLRLSSDNERYSDIVVSMEEVERLLVAKRYVSYRLNKRMKHVPKED